MQSSTKTFNSPKEGKQEFNKGKKPFRIPKVPCVHIVPGESLDSLVIRFQKAVERSGIMQEIEDNRFYQKPSQKRRLRKNSWRRQIKKWQKQRSN